MSFKYYNLIISISLCCCISICRSQELVRNGSFEDNTLIGSSSTTSGSTINWTNCSESSQNSPTPTNTQGPDNKSQQDLLDYWNNVDFWTVPDKKTICELTYAGVGSPDVRCSSSIQAHTGSWFGYTSGTETITQELSSSVQIGRYYQVDYYTTADKHDKIGLKFYKEKPRQCGSNQPSEPNSLIVPVINSNIIDEVDGWKHIKKVIKADKNYSWIAISHFVGSGQNANFDDISVIDLGCCPNSWEYTNTTDLPSNTQVINKITAGNLGNRGDTKVLSGQDVTFSAGNSIILTEGFVVESGGTFTAQIEACNGANNSSAESIILEHFPSFVSPNNNGISDEICIVSYNATEYHFVAYSPNTNVKLFESSGEVNSNYECVWNGECNNCINQSYVDIGYYATVLILTNCDDELGTGQTIFVSENGDEYNKMAITPPSPNEIISNELTEDPPLESFSKELQFLNIMPNPAKDGRFKLSFSSNSMKNINVYNNLGKLVYSMSIDGSFLEIDLSRFSRGVYHITILEGTAYYNERLVYEY
ncbi:MAG: T9SS type A sorting domain-containing protein [Flavobacteriales bacterium]|nr:T9SS type A sorting domain-containing protein [Flavobacteriales bacterium]